MERKTILSDDRVYRYVLWRDWHSTDTNFDPEKYLNVIGLNPSTADETKDDATIRKCVKFAKAWGCGALCMTNLFAFRAREPKDMKAAADPVGIHNDHYIRSMAAGASIVLCAWGNDGAYRCQDLNVRQALRECLIIPKCFRITKQKQPEHPLYQKDSAVLIDFPL